MVRECALDLLSGQRLGRIPGGGLEIPQAGVRPTVNDFAEPPLDVQAGPQHIRRHFSLQCIELLQPQIVPRACRGSRRSFAELSARLLRAHAVPIVFATLTLLSLALERFRMMKVEFRFTEYRGIASLLSITLME